MTITEIQEEIISEFSMFDNNNDKYNYIIELGKDLAPYTELYRTDNYLIKGCQSKVWVRVKQESETVDFEGDSDSVLVKGLVSLLIRVFTHQPAQEIVSTELYFLDKIGMKQMLSMNRANGLASMVKQIKMYALVLAQR